MTFPELWLIAGPNGAGETTCAQKEPIASLVEGVRFLNPDDRTLAKLRAAGYSGFTDAPVDIQTRSFIESADEVSAEPEACVAAGEPVGVEAVLSSDKYGPLVESVLQRAGVVNLIYVGLSSADISRERVAARVRRGGHGVPGDKLPRRWQGSLDRLGWFAQRATNFWVVDNSGSDPAAPPRLLAFGKAGRLDYHAPDAFPEMLAALAALPR